MADRTDDITFDPKTWISKAETGVTPAPVPAARQSGSRMGLALGLSALLLLAAAGAAYLTRAPVTAAAPAALR